MSPLVQHILALTIVALCVAYAGWHAVRALRGKRARAGSCCAAGCAEKPGSPSEDAPAKPSIAYIPVAMLSSRRRRQD